MRALTNHRIGDFVVLPLGFECCGASENDGALVIHNA